MLSIFLRRFLVVILFISFSFISLASDEMRVFFPTVIPVKDREKVLKKDPALNSIDITVLGKFREFKIANRNKAKFIIVPYSYTKYQSEYKPIFQFCRNGKSYERMMILSVENNYFSQNLNNAKIGIVDELERKPTKSHIREIAGSFKIIKRVTKPEDLYPLLILQNADCIIIRPQDYYILSQKFTTKTTIIGYSEPIKLPVLCVLQDKEGSIRNNFENISPETLKVLGYSELIKLK